MFLCSNTRESYIRSHSLCILSHLFTDLLIYLLFIFLNTFHLSCHFISFYFFVSFSLFFFLSFTYLSFYFHSCLPGIVKHDADLSGSMQIIGREQMLLTNHYKEKKISDNTKSIFSGTYVRAFNKYFNTFVVIVFLPFF